MKEISKTKIGTMITKTEFLKKAKEEIDFQDCEKKRKYLLYKMIFLKIVSVVFSFLIATIVIKLFIFAGLFSSHKINKYLYHFLVLLSYCMSFYFAWMYFSIKFKFDEFPLKFKNEYLKNKYNLLSICGVKQTYIGAKFIDLKNSHIFSSFTDIYDDDIFENELFTAVETELHNSYESKDSLIFKGVILLFKANKQIKSRTIVLSKKDINSNLNELNLKKIILEIILSPYLLPIYITIVMMLFTKEGKHMLSSYIYLFSIKSNIVLLSTLITVALFFITILFLYTIIPLLIDRYKFSKNRYRALHLEDITFDKRFYVYSEDQVEGRYLVTPAFMDRLQNLQTAFGVKNIKCSFFDDKIMFAISTNKDLFELGNLYRPFGKDIEAFYNQIASIYNIIDYFKLNERTGL